MFNRNTVLVALGTVLLAQVVVTTPVDVKIKNRFCFDVGVEIEGDLVRCECYPNTGLASRECSRELASNTSPTYDDLWKACGTTFHKYVTWITKPECQTCMSKAMEASRVDSGCHKIANPYK